MTDGEFDAPFDDRFDDEARENDETPEQTVERLRAEIAEGEVELKPELAEALMNSARLAAEDDEYDDALKLVDEALLVGNELVEEGQIEFRTSVGRCLLFRAAVTRLHQGAEAALLAFNEAIRYFAEQTETGDPDTQNELAVALVNKADLLIDPLGAHSAAIAAQEQAIRIWQRLVDDGRLQYRRPLASTLISCGDAKLQSGDPEKALLDLQKAGTLARDAVEEGEDEFRGALIQTLMRLTRLFEQVGDIQHAFETSTETVRFTEQIVDGESPQARMALTPLYLQQGLLYEKIGDSQTALDQFDRCRDVYLDVLADEPVPPPGDYIVRTGLANVMMCRGNMLADLKRSEEASEAFDESARLYREAENLRPEDDDDETFIPYSIAVVDLNHANMLASQNRFDEAVAIKENALIALRNRFEKGHEEILPNLISAYRKMIGIHRTRDDMEKTGDWLDRLVHLVDDAVDQGRLEYRGDLAVAYQMRSVFFEERKDLPAAEKDLYRALRLLRDIADEQDDTQEVQMAKFQWGELLERIALMYARQDRVDAALEMFRKAIDDVQMLYAEGNPSMVFDILLGYSQMVVFVDAVIRDRKKTSPEEDRNRWAHAALDAAESAVELSQRQRVQHGDELSTSMFFTMKLAFFRQVRGSLLLSLDEPEKAEPELSAAIDHWKSLIVDLDQLRSRRRYFEEEAGKPKTEEEPPDPYRDRYLYYVGELRQALQRRAHGHRLRENFSAAETDLDDDIELARDLITRGFPDSDRYLVFSLTNYAKELEDSAAFEKITERLDEAKRLMRTRFRSGEFFDDDFFMLRHVHVSYALYLLKHDRLDASIEEIREYTQELEAIQKFPEPGMWIKLCKALEIHAFWHLDLEKVKKVYEYQRRFIARHPEFETSLELIEYDTVLQGKIANPVIPELPDMEHFDD